MKFKDKTAFTFNDYTLRTLYILFVFTLIAIIMLIGNNRNDGSYCKNNKSIKNILK